MGGPCDDEDEDDCLRDITTIARDTLASLSPPSTNEEGERE